MEDDEEIQSQPSPGSGSGSGSGSPSSPRANGRITVTVAAPPPPQNTLTLALPIQQPRTAGAGGGGREDCWSEGATATLIEAWGERYVELSRGNLKQKHWKEVADIVGSREDYSKTPKTDIQCKNRIDTVKKKYKLEKAKIAAGSGPSKWPFFKRLDQLIGPTSSKIAVSTATTAPLSSSHLKVPVGIPVGVRSAVHYRPQKPQHPQKQQPFRRRRPADSDSSQSEPEDASPDSADSFPPERKKPKFQREANLNLNSNSNSGRVVVATGMDRDRVWGKSMKELTQAILKFGEAYEQAETSKLQQVVEMEKQRMKFAKELELQRMQFFMKTQVELSQLRQGRRVGSNHHSNNAPNNNNHSDSSN